MSLTLSLSAITVAKTEPPVAVDEVLKSKLKKNREKGVAIEGIRKKLEKKREAEAEKLDQVEKVSN